MAAGSLGVCHGWEHLSKFDFVFVPGGEFARPVLVEKCIQERLEHLNAIQHETGATPGDVREENTAVLLVGADDNGAGCFRYCRGTTNVYVERTFSIRDQYRLSSSTDYY